MRIRRILSRSFGRNPPTRSSPASLALHSGPPTRGPRNPCHESLGQDTSLKKYLSDVPAETAYCKCFTDLLRHVGNMAKRQEGETRDAKFEFVFDSRLETDGTASQIYRSFRTLPEWRDTAT